MLQLVSSDDLLRLMREDHPQWTESNSKRIAEEMAALLDPMFDIPLKTWIVSRDMTNVRHGEFDLVTIRNIHPECTYLDMIRLLDAYIKNPVEGKIRILMD